MSKPVAIEIPTPEEDARITAAALNDPDNLPLLDVELVQFKRLPKSAEPTTCGENFSDEKEIVCHRLKDQRGKIAGQIL
ncbi:MAG: hypothetical protein HQL56_04785 [Magnetococcales bacterium]|nr:hypothetical protein [Magnetococcales bacterium]